MVNVLLVTSLQKIINVIYFPFLRLINVFLTFPFKLVRGVKMDFIWPSLMNANQWIPLKIVKNMILLRIKLSVWNVVGIFTVKELNVFKETYLNQSLFVQNYPKPMISVNLVKMEE